ncbi:Hint domain-containing protein [Ruegeria sp. SCP11]|uniref:Hint domain-containing protein n=1 Tax=Ruegeria sp. SCP11 TaxID=3141378 RepID=UPI003336FC67
MPSYDLLVYRIATGDDTYQNTGNFTIEVAGEVTIEENNGVNDTIFNDFTHGPNQADASDQEVIASSVSGIDVGETLDARYSISFTGSDGSTGTVHVLFQNEESWGGSTTSYPLIVSDTPLDPTVTYTFGANNVNGFVEYDDLYICFAKGTKILTVEGEKPVEELKTGDRIKTKHNGAQPIKWIGFSTVNALGKAAPIVFDPYSINNTEQLVLSPLHRIVREGWRAELLFGEKEVFVEAKSMVNGDSIRQVPRPSITYYHVMLEQHEVIYANGAEAETLYLGEIARSFMTEEQLDEVSSIFPELFCETSTHVGGVLLRSLTNREGKLLAERFQ